MGNWCLSRAAAAQELLTLILTDSPSGLKPAETPISIKTVPVIIELKMMVASGTGF